MTHRRIRVAIDNDEEASGTPLNHAVMLCVLSPPCLKTLIINQIMYLFAGR